MKNKAVFQRMLMSLLAFLSTTVVLQSCSKSSANTSSDNPSGYYLSATVEGKSWVANVKSTLNGSTAIAATTTSNSVSFVVLIGLTVSGNDTTAIALVFPQNITVGTTYNFDETQYREGAYISEIAPGSGTYYGYNTTAATGGSGTIVVSKFDQTNQVIEGSFTGIFGSQQNRAAIHISNGKFRCPYTNEINQLPLSGVKF